MHIQKLKKNKLFMFMANWKFSWQNICICKFCIFTRNGTSYCKKLFKACSKISIKVYTFKKYKSRKTAKNNHKTIRCEKQTKNEDYIKILQKKYTLLDRNVVPFGEIKFGNFNSDLLLFKIR